MLFFVYLFFPILEIYLLFRAGAIFGFWPIFFVTVFTAWAGSRLVKYQGLLVFNQFQKRMAEGQVPQKEATDGLMLLIGGVLLIAPGFITDIIGFLCVIPGTRQIMSLFFGRWMAKKVKEGKVHVFTNVNMGQSPFGRPGGSSRQEVRDVTPVDPEKLGS